MDIRILNLTFGDLGPGWARTGDLAHKILETRLGKDKKTNGKKWTKLFYFETLRIPLTLKLTSLVRSSDTTHDR